MGNRSLGLGFEPYHPLHQRLSLVGQLMQLINYKDIAWRLASVGSNGGRSNHCRVLPSRAHARSGPSYCSTSESCSTTDNFANTPSIVRA